MKIPMSLQGFRTLLIAVLIAIVNYWGFLLIPLQWTSIMSLWSNINYWRRPLLTSAGFLAEAGVYVVCLILVWEQYVLCTFIRLTMLTIRKKKSCLIACFFQYPIYLVPAIALFFIYKNSEFSFCYNGLCHVNFTTDGNWFRREKIILGAL